MQEIFHCPTNAPVSSLKLYSLDNTPQPEIRPNDCNTYVIYLYIPTVSSAKTVKFNFEFEMDPGVIIATATFSAGDSNMTNKRSYINMYQGTETSDSTLVAREHSTYHTNSDSTRLSESVCTGIFYRTRGQTTAERKGMINCAITTKGSSGSYRINLNFFCLCGSQILNPNVVQLT